MSTDKEKFIELFCGLGVPMRMVGHEVWVDCNPDSIGSDYESGTMKVMFSEQDELSEIEIYK